MRTPLDEAIKNPEIKKDLQRKFENRLQIGTIPSNKLCNVDTPCHYLNRGHIRKSNYMVVHFSNKRLGYHLPNVRAHILAFLLYIGDRLDFQINHTCNNQWCVNPAHLVTGGSKPNIRHASGTKENHTPDQESWILSQPNRIEIRNLKWLDGLSSSYLAEKFHVSVTAINKVLRTPEPEIQRKE